MFISEVAFPWEIPSHEKISILGNLNLMAHESWDLTLHLKIRGGFEWDISPQKKPNPKRFFCDKNIENDKIHIA